MISLQDTGSSLCDGLTRREWLRIGSLGVGGLSLAQLLAAREANGVGKGRARSCIVMFLLGGPAQHETWDPKPDAPTGVRGDLKPIASATPGVLVGELMPKVAKLTHKLAILRAMQTNDHSHSSSGYYMTTGHPHVPIGVENAKPGAPNDWPSFGALVRRLWNRPCPLPAAITLPEQSANDGNLTWPGQDAGFLGRNTDPWLLHCEPETPGFSLPGLRLPDELPPLRFDQRRSLHQQLNHGLDSVLRSTALDAHDFRTRQAFDMIASGQGRRAFNLDLESPQIRDRYGRTRFGQSTLLARRLVEAGVPFVRVNWTRVKGAVNNGHWDTHSKNTEGHKQLMPIMDQSFSALIEDLSDRGLLDETVVVLMAEFGRTPKLNGGGGRDHWGSVFSIALAGGGIRGGVVHGSSDAIAAYPRDGRVLPQDLTATLFELLGIPPHTMFQDHVGRPIPASTGKVVEQIL